MKFPILTAALLLCLIIAYNNRRSKRSIADEENAFWSREQEANNTRRKSLDDLDYVRIPLDKLPLDKHFNNDNIQQYIDTIVELSKSPIVNLSGISNTDLKLKYGAPNIDTLVRYDSRYTTLSTTLQRLGQALYDEGYIEDAKTVLEYAISTRSDISQTYKLLGDIYKSDNNSSGISDLIQKAEELTTPMKSSILDYLMGLQD